jgi:uncharacterized membrane protein YbaN (DUF454 family)
MKYFFICAGFILFASGIAGLFVPVLPSTPFLLAAAYCFSKGSKRFNDWFVSTRLYKNHIESFARSRSMALKSKIIILAYATLLIAAAAYFVKSAHVRIFLAVLIAVKYYYFIFKIKTAAPENKTLPIAAAENLSE